MGINSAISNALSGLRVTSRNAEIVSRNVSNALTEGYTQKSLVISHQVNGYDPGGVRVDGVQRAGDPFLTAARRRDEASAQNLSAEADALRTISDLVLDPDGGDSLQSRYLAFENSMRALADTPESAALQRETALAGRSLARKINMLSTDAKRMRVDADSEIQRQVETVNRAMKRIAQLNKDIISAEAAGRDASALEDERDRQIDVVNAIIPIKESKPVNGGMLITTQGGGLLMNGGTPYLISFDPSTPLGVTGANELNGLTHLGRTSLDTDELGLDGGSLEAAFKVRDQHAVAFSGQLDALARDLIEGFQGLHGYVTHIDTDADTVLDAPAPGLFTDAGAGLVAASDAFLAPTAEQVLADTEGLAGRIALNVAVDAAEGGDPGALKSASFLTVDPVDPPNTPLPSALYSVFSAEQNLSSADVAGGLLGQRIGIFAERNRVDMVTEWAGLLEVAAGSIESEASFRLGAAEALRDEEVAKMGVDTDEEMRQLLLIEKAYAANAQVLQVADQMLAELLSIR